MGEFENVHTGQIRTMAVTNDDKRLITGSFDGLLKVMCLDNFVLLHTIVDIDEATNAISIVGDSYFVSAGSDRVIHFWSLDDYNKAFELNGVHEMVVLCLKSTQDGKFVVSGG